MTKSYYFFVNVIEYSDYRVLLKDLMTLHPKGGHGSQTRLAEEIGCQQAYLSRVISGKADLSTDQVVQICDYFFLDSIETDFFLFLCLSNRSSNPKLKAYYEKKKGEIRLKKQKVSERIKPFDHLEENEIAEYYSDWTYSAVHMLTLIEEYKTVPSIAKKLKINEQKVRQVVEFLIGIGVLEKEKNKFSNCRPFLHLSADSTFISQHHKNWRMNTISSIGISPGLEDLHYSSVISCSKGDSSKIKEIFIEAIKNARELVKKSRDEDLFYYGVDFQSF